MSLCPHGYTAFYDCPECPEPMGTAGTLHWSGGEWVYDAECDCPRCTDYRDSHCIKCGEPHVWHGRDEADRVCGSCRYFEADQHNDENYKPGHSSDLAF
jgi:hypothetical protein